MSGPLAPSRQSLLAAARTAAGLAHTRDLREARERQLALIAIAAGTAAARRPQKAPAVALAPAPPTEEDALPAEQRRRRARIRQLGICGPVDPDAPARRIGEAPETAPAGKLP